MDIIFVTTGLACIIAAIIGGGVKAFGIELPTLASRKSRIGLGVLGALLIGCIVLKEPVGRLLAKSTLHSNDSAGTLPTQSAQPTAAASAPVEQKTSAAPAKAANKALSSNGQSPQRPQHGAAVPESQPTAPKQPIPSEASPVKTPLKLHVEPGADPLIVQLTKYTNEYYALHPDAPPKEVLAYVRDKLDQDGIHARFWLGNERVKFPCKLKNTFMLTGKNAHIDGVTVEGCASDSAILVQGEGNVLAHATVIVGEDEEQATTPDASPTRGNCPRNTAICQVGDGSKTTDSRFFGGRWDHLIYTNGVKSEVANTLYVQELNDATSSPANLQSAIDTIRNRQKLSWASLSVADRSTKEDQAKVIQAQIKATDINDQAALETLLDRLIALI